MEKDSPGDGERSNVGGGDADWRTLADRAALFLRRVGGRAAEEQLVAEVFGVVGGLASWRPLLARVLGDRTRFHRLPDGSWSLPDRPAAADWARELSFTAVDVEVSGRGAVRHKVIELGAVRVRAGQPVAEYSSLVNPRRRLPGYVTRLTGITQEMLEEAPDFAAVADELRHFVGDDPLVSFGFDGALDVYRQQLLLEGQPALLNEALDLALVANRRADGERKRDLAVLGAQFGLPVGRRHRALPDAQTIARLVPWLFRSVHEDAHPLEAFLPSPDVPDKPDASFGPGLSRHALGELPDAPGVYVMKDRQGRVLYVGKARSLRQRVASYFSQPLAYVRNISGLLEMASGIEILLVGSEVEALLLEMALIRHLSPVFNVQRRYADNLLYVKLDVHDPFPRLGIAREIESDGAAYFGPFRNGPAAREAIRWVTSLFPIRTCRRKLDAKRRRRPLEPCLRLAGGKCLGPCSPGASAPVYRGLVDDAWAFLMGDRERARQRLLLELTEARRDGDFRKETSARGMLRKVGQGSIGDLLVGSAVEAKNLAIVQPSTAQGFSEIFLIRGGRYAGQLRVAHDETPHTVAGRLEEVLRAGYPPPEHARRWPLPDQTDAANILTRWAYAHAGQPTLVPLPPEASSGRLVERACAILSAARNLSLEPESRAFSQWETAADPRPEKDRGTES